MGPVDNNLLRLALLVGLEKGYFQFGISTNLQKGGLDISRANFWPRHTSPKKSNISLNFFEDDADIVPCTAEQGIYFVAQIAH